MSESTALYVLLAPVGQLAGNGQLRETVRERRNRKGDDVKFWYLSPELVRKFQLSKSDCEAVVSDEATAINWVKLRFGGEIVNAEIDISELRVQASELPPAPSVRDISSN